MRTALIALLFMGIGLIAADAAFSQSVTLTKDNYSIQYPAAWRLDTSGRMGPYVFFFSEKQSDTDKFLENVNIFIIEVGPADITYDHYIPANENQVKTMLNNVAIVESSRPVKEGKEFYKLVFTSRQGVLDLKTVQYTFLKNGTAYVVTFTSQADQYDNFLPVAETMLNSFALKN